MRHALQRCARSAGLTATSVCLALALGQAASTSAASSSAAAAGPASPPGASATSPPTPAARLLFLGDITLGRYVGASLTAHGPDAPFDRARTWLSAADVTVANLEGPLVPDGTRPIPPPSPQLLDLTGRAAYAGGLARAGFDVLSVANNHSLDAGEAGLAHTRRALQGVGIAPIGLPAAAQAPLIRDVRGLRIAFLAYTLVLNPTAPPSRAAAAVAYVDPAAPADSARAASEVARARADAKADVVAVILHWGTEYAERPSADQRRFARALADAGADIVVGAHPHVVQSVESLAGAPPQPSLPSARRTALVAYSLGNALFDQVGDPATRRGAALEVVVGPGGVRWSRLVPLAIEAGPNGFAMRPLSSAGGATSRTGSQVAPFRLLTAFPIHAPQATLATMLGR